MTWDPTTNQADEASKIRWETVPYFHGRVLDIGCGRFKTFPHWIGCDSGKEWGAYGIDVTISDADDLGLFTTASCDGVFSSHLLEHIPYEQVPKVLAEWCRVTKDGGHIMLYVPDEDEYPKVGEPGANPDHKWNVNYDKIIECMDKVPRGWDLVEYQKRNGGHEYSLWFVFKLSKEGRAYSYQKPKPTKTCAVVRLGAFGDLIQASSIFPWLKEQGYHITLYCSDHGYPVVQHDPNIDRVIIQGRDEVPPQFLSEFWIEEKQKYTRWINLSESVEGTLLASPGSSRHWWPNEVRAKYLNVNYLEFTHEIAQVPPPYRPKFYSTIEERAWAKEKARSYGKRNILWSLSGSSVHKAWPHLDLVIHNILVQLPDVHVVLVGDYACKILETGWDDHPRVHCRSGVWSIRESMAFAEVADLVIGCETGLMNAAGSMDTPKVVTLSHSSPEMLTKHWKNTIALSQPKGAGCDMQPCRILHQTWEFCKKHEETGTALCQHQITPDAMWNAITRFVGKERMVA